MATSPKLQFAVPGIAWSGPKGPMTPKLVTAAPRATIEPLWFQTIQTATPAVVSAATTVGWSTLPANEARFVNVAPPSVLRRVTMAFTELLMYVMKRFPYLSQAKLGSQQACGPSDGLPLAMVFEGSG